MLKFACIAPHAPIIVPSVGKEETAKVEKTVKSFEELTKDLQKTNPETLVIVSPHTPLLPEAFGLAINKNFSGDLIQFGDLETKLSFNLDEELAKEIEKVAKKRGLPLQTFSLDYLDHGIVVPLSFLTKNLKEIKLVCLTFSYLDRQSHFLFGKILQEIMQKSDKNIAFIASGDLSHALTPDAPGGFHPDGKKFDQEIVSLVKEEKLKEIIDLDKNLVANAAECGYRSILILSGLLDGLPYQTKFLSYEGPFGVGYLVSEFLPG